MLAGLTSTSTVAGEPMQDLLEALALTEVDGVAGGDELRDLLGELTQLGDRRGRIIAEVALCEPAERRQPVVVRCQKTEVE